MIMPGRTWRDAPVVMPAEASLLAATEAARVATILGVPGIAVIDIYDFAFVVPLYSYVADYVWNAISTGTRSRT